MFDAMIRLRKSCESLFSFMFDSKRLLNRAILPPKNQSRYHNFLDTLAQLASVRDDDLQDIAPRETFIDDSGKLDSKEEKCQH